MSKTNHQLGISKKYRTIVIDPPWEVKFVSAGVHGKPVTELPTKL